MISSQKTYGFFYQLMLLFAFLGVIFIPFSFRTWSFQASVTKYIFEDFILLIANSFKDIQLSNPAFSSDSTSFYFLFLILFGLAILLRIGLFLTPFWKQYQETIIQFIQLILVYYLSVIMLKYGFSKVFKAQFYLPEPNTLYTPLGLLDKDILFWSTMGVSYSYNVFMGLSEVIPAIMLLHHKTRNFGLFLLSGILIHVVWINFSFDISVKLFSLFLLFITILLLAPSFKKLFQFFILNKLTTLPYLRGQQLIQAKIIRYFAKAIILLFIFIETLFPYIQSGQFNDDKTSRLPLHGAYEITSVASDKTEENLEDLNLKRFFIHRQAYFIFQYDDDSMEDFKLHIDTVRNELNLTDYDGNSFDLAYKVNKASNSIEIKSIDLGWIINAHPLPWKDLPLLQPLFHWTVDEI